MSTPEHVLVIDIGKTNAKLALVDTGTLAEIEVLTRPNRVLAGPPYPHADVEGLWAFILDGARRLHARHRVDALVATTHAATAALLDADGGSRAAGARLRARRPGRRSPIVYDAVRPPFEETGSPRLPAGLNLGAQLFWQAQSFPDAVRPRRVDPHLSAVLGLPALRHRGQRSDVARLPHRSLEPAAP